MKTILLTGTNGYLASYVYRENKDTFDWIRMTRKDADLSRPEDVKAFLDAQNFDICYHTAANATTAICEANPELAHKINVESTQMIIQACKDKPARLIFSGTEQSFNGKENRGPFSEDEPLKAVTVYGKNKSECEQLIHEQLDNAIILRYSWMMGLSCDGMKASPNIIKNVMTALLHQKPTLFTCNEKRGITYAKHLARQFKKITELPAGTYHISAYNDKTTYESAVYVAQQIGAASEAIEKYIVPNKERYADRFRDYRLNTQKLQNLGFTFGTFEENVAEVLKDFNWDK